MPACLLAAVRYTFPVRIAVLICFIVLLGVPFLFRPENQAAVRAGDAAELIIITPHNEQIRSEFGTGFDLWHFAKFGTHVKVIWNVPGGTSEIRKMLEAQYLAAFESGATPGGKADMVFGGGSFEHSRLKRGVTVTGPDGKPHDQPISEPVDFTDAWLHDIYGENRIGDDPLYDQDEYWFGLALSGFGIVFNRDSLRSLDVPDPQRWDDLCNPRLVGNVALVNPGQSGSITTAFDAILKRNGWEQGWRILHRAGANARYFSASSLKPPIDVTQGNAAMAVTIDFYGRYQSQAIEEIGGGSRVGYIDPIGGTILDTDPISMLRGAPHPELSKRFIEFCLSDQGQALWQFRKHAPPGPNVGGGGDDLGPQQFELRRLPIRRVMYEKHFDRMIDKVNPFDMATPIEYPNPNFRDFIAPLFSAMVMDTHEGARAAWKAIISHPAFPAANGLVKPEEIADERLRNMIELFDAMPTITGPDGQVFSLDSDGSLAEVRNGWLRGGWTDKGLWHSEASPVDVMRRQFADFFRVNYRRIVELAKP